MSLSLRGRPLARPAWQTSQGPAWGSGPRWRRYYPPSLTRQPAFSRGMHHCNKETLTLETLTHIVQFRDYKRRTVRMQWNNKQKVITSLCRVNPTRAGWAWQTAGGLLTLCWAACEISLGTRAPLLPRPCPSTLTPRGSHCARSGTRTAPTHDCWRLLRCWCTCPTCSWSHEGLAWIERRVHSSRSAGELLCRLPPFFSCVWSVGRQPLPPRISAERANRQPALRWPPHAGPTRYRQSQLGGKGYRLPLSRSPPPPHRPQTHHTSNHSSHRRTRT